MIVSKGLEFLIKLFLYFFYYFVNIVVILSRSYTTRKCNKCVCYSNYAASITYNLHWK